MSFENPGEWNRELKELLEYSGVFHKYSSDNWFKLVEDERNEELSEYLFNKIIDRYNSHYQMTTKPKKNYTAKEHDDRMWKSYFALLDELAMRGLEDEAQGLEDLIAPIFDNNDTPPRKIPNRTEESEFKSEVLTQLVVEFNLSEESAKIITTRIAEIDRNR